MATPFIALSHLICASLAEDRYGTVQRDIPKILEVMVSYLTAVEEYQIEVNNLLKPLPETPLPPKEQEEYDVLAIEIHKSQEILGFVADGGSIFSIPFYLPYADTHHKKV